MCGIAGAAGVQPRDRSAAMRAMRDRLIHRGPDSGGEFGDNNTALGIRRLRIIDLVTGDQPQANEDGTVWTVFNGEIYNFRELRDELRAKGHTFANLSDTEVIVHLYEEHGDRFAERLEGMFALAVWDSKTRTLVLARDRLGKKPLLYHESDGEIIFASEHHALLAALPGPPEVDLQAIGLYLRLGFVPAPMDAFAGVRKLLPAHVLVWRDGRSSIRRYWAPPAPGTLRITEQEATVELRRLLSLAVSRRLVADVPLGAFLSGGVDSSAVVATMASLTSKVRTFAIGFEEPEFSELAHARRIAEKFGTEHHEFVLRPIDLDILPLLVRHYGEPYADSSAVPTYHLSKLTRQSVTVALNGDGGDELFAGYDRYLAVRLAATLDRIPASVRQPVLR
ncbi:MAG: asparagine synthase (glutamine-hydrolyzing), partial [Candidatus Dormibacteraeota bacterium]|nr:asparagine synthase (glutamine-hydrolyzing) [Candidatus Dormibacteraeota bacterium]